MAADEISAESSRLYNLAVATVGKPAIDIPNMVEPGTTVEAGCDWQIEQHIPNAEYPEQYAHYGALLKERRAAFDAHFPDDIDDISAPVYSREGQALLDFAETVPTTLAGLLAMIVYADEIEARDPQAFTDRDECSLIQTLAIAARVLGCGETNSKGRGASVPRLSSNPLLQWCKSPWSQPKGLGLRWVSNAS